MNSDARKTIPAEWEVDGDILMAWPHSQTDWSYMLDQVQQCYLNIMQALNDAGIRVILLCPPGEPDPRIAGIESGMVIPVEYLTNDTWTRDYGPIAFSDDSYADFRFNGWGLKFASDRDNLATLFMRNKGLLRGRYQPRLDFVLEGGSIESDGRGTILTTTECLMNINRNGGKYTPGLKERIQEYLSAECVHYVNHGYLAGDDTDSHIDTLARLAPFDTIVYVGCQDSADEHYQALNQMKRDLQELRTPDSGMPYTLIELPLPDPIYDEEGNRLPATYANFLVTPRGLFMPTYGQEKKDLLAGQILEVAYELPVYTIDCRALIQQHGSLHCATMQIPKSLITI